MKDRLGPGPPFGDATPTGTAGTGFAFTPRTVADKIDVDVFGIGRPVLLEIIEEGRPVRFKVMDFEITQWERKTVVNTDDGRHIFGQPLY